MRHLASVPDRPGRAVLYVRVSALMGRGGDDFHSPDLQLGAMRRAIASAGLQEVGVVDDDIDVTGRTFSRRGLDKIRAMAEARQIDAIAVYNVSRLGRNVLESLQFLNWLADRGVTILSASEHIDTSTPAGRWMLTNMLGVAEMRSDEIGESWGAIIAARAGKGKHHGNPPTGYQRGPDGALEPHPVHGPAVTEAFRSYAAGAAVRDVRERLHAATGLAIAASTVKRLLSNPTYRGIVRLRPGGAAGQVTTENAHPPLVEADVWDRAQARMAADRRTPPRLLGPQYSLSGIGRCGRCGGHTNIRPHRVGPRMHCRDAYEGVGQRCAGCGSVALADAEGVVLLRVGKWLENLRGNVAAQAAQLARAARAGADADSLNRELSATRKAMAKLTERWARGRVDDRTYEDTMDGFRADEGRLSAALAETEHTAAAVTPQRAIPLADQLLSRWEKMTGGERNRVLRELVSTVIVHPSAHYRQPVHQRVKVQFR